MGTWLLPVVAGIDFALHIATEIVGEETAQAIQLSIEYDPAPPFTWDIRIGLPHRSPRSLPLSTQKGVWGGSAAVSSSTFPNGGTCNRIVLGIVRDNCVGIVLQN